MSSRQFTKEEQAEAQQSLRKLLKPGDEIKVFQRHVSSSGMSRRLSLFYVNGKGDMFDITRNAAAAMGDRLQDDHTIRVGGAGMDMHFAIVYGLSSVLFRDGFKCTGDRTCRSNDHSNDYLDAQQAYYAEHPEDNEYFSDDEARLAAHGRMREYVDNRLNTDLGYRKGRKHRDGGYALTKRSM